MTKLERIMFEKSSDYAWDYLKEDDVGLVKSSFEAGFTAAMDLPELKEVLGAAKKAETSPSYFYERNMGYLRNAISDYESLFKEGE